MSWKVCLKCWEDYKGKSMNISSTNFVQIPIDNLPFKKKFSRGLLHSIVQCAKANSGISVTGNLSLKVQALPFVSEPVSPFFVGKDT